jgi:thiol-disulfide isomerase/thioredoxin
MRFLALSFFLLPAAFAQSLTGLWDATIDVNGTPIPFRLELSADTTHAQGSFFNGEDRETSVSGAYDNGTLTLNFDSYAAVLRLKFADGALDGEYTARNRPQHVHAVRAAAHKAAANAPNIDGLWYMENVPSSKGEKAWNLIVKQNAGEVRASILRVDGDTGTLEGAYDGSKFVLSHFDGARPAVVHITPTPDGNLSVALVGQQRNGAAILAVRPAIARAQGLALPTGPNEHTAVKDASQPFPFSFPDLSGKIVSNTDPRFRGKVVLINITGSWCPNCHDEAPFLAEIYNKYRAQGLEIVALSFEEAEQLQNPTRLRAFIKQAGIKYTVLLGGETGSAKEKLSQALNWDAWPTTFFVGRDGLVKAVHAGFPSPGSGDLYKQEKQEFIATVERLLAENQTSRN